MILNVVYRVFFPIFEVMKKECFFNGVLYSVYYIISGLQYVRKEINLISQNQFFIYKTTKESFLRVFVINYNVMNNFIKCYNFVKVRFKHFYHHL